MTHSEEPDRRVLVATCYLDDSGTDEASPTAVIAGPVMAKRGFCDFDPEWRRILCRHRIEWPLHMTDFKSPHGRYCGMYPEMKLALFEDVANAINKHKIYSMAISVPQVEYKLFFPIDVYRQYMAPYGMAFFAAALGNHSLGKQSHYLKQIGYLIDHGNFDDQLLTAHRLLCKWEAQSGKSMHIGAIAFDTDARVSALQAADVIASVSRLLIDHGELPAELAPLNRVVAQNTPPGAKPHVRIDMGLEAVVLFAANLNQWLESHGESAIPGIPLTADILNELVKALAPKAPKGGG